MDLSGEKPIEYKVLSIDEKYGTEEKFRSIHLQGFRPGAIAVAMRNGKPYDGYRWKRIWVWYRIETELGQILDCVWDARHNAFSTREGGVLISRRWIRSAEEFEVTDEKEEKWACLR